MSEYWDPTKAVDPPAPPAAAVTPDAAATPPDGVGTEPRDGSAIPLPPVGGAPGAATPVHVPAPWDPTRGHAPTGEQPTLGSGAPTPPAGTWGPPPQSVWSAGPTGSGAPPYMGWPPQATQPAAAPTAPAKKRSGLAAALAAVVVVVAVVGGVGLGHAVWPTSSTTAASASPSTGSGGTGSSGSGSSPFGSGSASGSNPFGGGSSGGGSSSSGSSGSSGSTSTGAGAPSDISSIAAKVSPGLVDINTNLSYQDEQAAGTGMVLTSDGEVLTNNHVIDGATSISVTDVGNGKTYSASVVGYDRTGDVAVIKLSGASGLQTVTTASGTASVGQAIVGVGNAGGTGGTPSAAGGSVTALNQSITASDDGGGNAENLTGLIEINAGIEPGDSGGSLVDAQGQVLGMDTAASSDSSEEDVAAQAYAIPIGTALSVAKKIEAGQSSSTIHIGPTAFLGVGVGGSSGSTGSGSSGSGGFGSGGSGSFGFGESGGFGSDGSGTSANSSGAVVSQVLSGSVAGQAGVVVGDTITSFNGTTVSSATALTQLLEPEHPGDTVQLQWTTESGQTQSASVKLGSGPPA